ncbi:hypothetical protein [Rhizobium binxianense]
MQPTTRRNTASGIDGETKVTAARKPRGSARLKRMLSLDDFEHEARRYVPHPIFSYVNSGSRAMTTFRENRSAFDDFRAKALYLLLHRFPLASFIDQQKKRQDKEDDREQDKGQRTGQ